MCNSFVVYFQIFKTFGYKKLKNSEYNYLNEQVERLDDTNKDFIIILGHRIK